MWWFPLSIPNWSSHPVLKRKFVVDNVEVKVVDNLECKFFLSNMYILCMWQISHCRVPCDTSNTKVSCGNKTYCLLLVLGVLFPIDSGSLVWKFNFLVDNPKVKIVDNTEGFSFKYLHFKHVMRFALSLALHYFLQCQYGVTNVNLIVVDFYSCGHIVRLAQC